MQVKKVGDWVRIVGNWTEMFVRGKKVYLVEMFKGPGSSST